MAKKTKVIAKPSNLNLIEIVVEASASLKGDKVKVTLYDQDNGIEKNVDIVIGLTKKVINDTAQKYGKNITLLILGREIEKIEEVHGQEGERITLLTDEVANKWKGDWTDEKVTKLSSLTYEGNLVDDNNKYHFNNFALLSRILIEKIETRNFFIFELEDVLISRVGSLWRKGYLPPPKDTDEYERYKNELFFHPGAKEVLSYAAGTNDETNFMIILSMLWEEEIAEYRKFLNTNGIFHVHIFSLFDVFKFIEDKDDITDYIKEFFKVNKTYLDKFDNLYYVTKNDIEKVKIEIDNKNIILCHGYGGENIALKVGIISDSKINENKKSFKDLIEKEAENPNLVLVSSIDPLQKIVDSNKPFYIEEIEVNSKMDEKCQTKTKEGDKVLVNYMKCDDMRNIVNKFCISGDADNFWIFDFDDTLGSNKGNLIECGLLHSVKRTSEDIEKDANTIILHPGAEKVLNSNSCKNYKNKPIILTDRGINSSSRLQKTLDKKGFNIKVYGIADWKTSDKGKGDYLVEFFNTNIGALNSINDFYIVDDTEKNLSNIFRKFVPFLEKNRKKDTVTFNQSARSISCISTLFRYNRKRTK